MLDLEQCSHDTIDALIRSLNRRRDAHDKAMRDAQRQQRMR